MELTSNPLQDSYSQTNRKTNVRNTSPSGLFLISILSLAILEGCTTNRALTKPSQDLSAPDYTATLRSETSTGLDNSLGAALREGVRVLGSGKSNPSIRLKETSHETVNRPEYSAIATWWCPRHQEISNAAQLSRKYGELCKQRGSVWKEPYCLTQNEDPLFLASVRPTTLCSGPQGVQVYVVEGKGDLRSKEYTTALAVSGNETSRDRKASPVRVIAENDPTNRSFDYENTIPPGCRFKGEVKTESVNSQYEADAFAKNETVRRGGNVLQMKFRSQMRAPDQYDKLGNASDAPLRGQYVTSGRTFNCS